MKYYLKALRNYAIFRGRARRSEYWYFVLFNIIFAFVAIILDNVLGMTTQGAGLGPIYLLYVLAVLLPGLAVAVRRLHDVGKSGWFLLFAIVPFLNIWIIVLLASDGNIGENKYGTNPKETLSTKI